MGYFDICIFSLIISIDFYHLLANLLHIMDKRYLKVFELCFQSKTKARKQKEAGEAVGSSGVEQRRKRLKIQGTRRVASKIQEDNGSVTYRVR